MNTTHRNYNKCSRRIDFSRSKISSVSLSTWNYKIQDILAFLRSNGCLHVVNTL